MKIHRLSIFTSDLGAQLRFYTELLGPGNLVSGDDGFEVKLGYSVLEFKKAENATPYHIAFHIEAEKEEQALAWLKARLSILPDEGKEIVDFPAWNARSVYFHDADKNILEFISRRHWFPSEGPTFGPDSIKGISEIGIATTEVKRVFDLLHSKIGLIKFTGDYEVFCATGDDEGLFIVIDREKKTWFPVGEKAFPSPFKIDISNNGQSYALAYINESLKLL